MVDPRIHVHIKRHEICEKMINEQKQPSTGLTLRELYFLAHEQEKLNYYVSGVLCQAELLPWLVLCWILPSDA